MKVRNFVSFIAVLVIGLFVVACGSEPEVITETIETIVTQEVEVVREVEVVVTEVVETVREVEREVVTEVEVLALPAVDPIAARGTIITAGSSTVFPLAEVIAARWEEEGGPPVSIDSIGSGAGFERFCVETESDIANASRPIRDNEVEECRANGRDPIEIRVGTDALAVVTSAENDFLTDITLEELAAIFSTAETWADVNPDWPAEPILRYIPGTDSGTFDYFVEEVFDEEEGPILAANNLELSEDDNVLVQGILGSPYAIGFFGYAYYQENAGALNILSIEGVEATAENVDAATYPLARPLFIYTTADIMVEKPQVADYVNYFLTNVNEVIDEVGYFPANTAALNAAKTAWLAAVRATTPAAGITLPVVDPLAHEGTIITAGSSTVFPLAEVVAARWEEEGGPPVSIDSIGSGAGFERFCVETESDIANASRPIRDNEVEECRANGRDPIEIRVGTDALAVVTSAENDFLTDVTLEELAAIFSTAETWADVNPDWPAEPILRYIPGTDSGTFDYFVEEVFDEEEGPILAANNLELSEDDNVLVQGILGSPYAIGFFGYAYYQENAGTLNILAIEGVEATAENVDAATYPLARPLFIYTTADIMAEKPQVAAYVNYFLTNVNEVIDEVGYFPAPEDALLSAKAAWLAANN